ncbi:hypothetical protein JCM33374_g6525 [Metschnikowia sp. JCM 33374]|nr:hypothetical protein JCM33374_g6525 [Metschnikowia sp. JCM 33374]
MFIARGSRRKTVLAIVLLTCVALLLMEVFYAEKETWSPKIINLDILSSTSRTKKVLLPAGFRFPKSLVQAHLKGTASEQWPTFQIKDSEVMDVPPSESRSFKVTESVLYAPSSNKNCRESAQKMKLATDDSERLSLNLGKIFEIFLEEAETYHDPYNQHLLPILEEYISQEMFKTHWYRLSGSSVWLKDYSVHFVVSRLMMSEIGSRGEPRISMLLAQVYDEEWNEVEDVRLVFPTNSIDSDPNPLGFRLGTQDFSSYRFPRILPIPFDVGTGHNFWGAEDPRMLLVKSKTGHEEPVVVFNAYISLNPAEKAMHRVYARRSMFMGFPFQVQKGKSLEIPNSESTQNNWFTRTKKLKVKKQLERLIEKNWAPFVSANVESHDHIMFVTQFTPLNIIKCDLWTDDEDCEPEGTPTKNAAGSLRGGTPLLSVGSTPDEDGEFFVGFARAHFKGCGCGKKFYRPNLVVVARIGTRWVLSHVSSFIDLGMEVIPWFQP